MLDMKDVKYMILQHHFLWSLGFMRCIRSGDSVYFNLQWTSCVKLNISFGYFPDCNLVVDLMFIYTCYLKNIQSTLRIINLKYEYQGYDASPISLWLKYIGIQNCKPNQTRLQRHQNKVIKKQFKSILHKLSHNINA